MRRSKIVKVLTKAGIDAEMTGTGLTVMGVNVIHRDKTGISMFRRSQFKSRDVFEFLQNLHYEGMNIESEYFRKVRKIEKEL